jgi:glycosidase
MMLAEDDRPAQHLASFDLTYDWDTYSVLGQLAKSDLQPVEVTDVLSEQDFDFPRDSLRMRFSSNHDMCAWHEPAFTRYGKEAAPLAAALTFLLPGVPLIYNGQEAANDQKLALFEKVPIDWQANDQGLRKVFTDLARLRRDRISLRRGAFEVLPIPGHQSVLAFLRTKQPEKTVVITNLSNTEVAVDLAKLGMKEPKALLSHNLSSTSDGTLRLGAFGYWVGADE